MRLELDAVRGLVNLLIGLYCVDQLTTQEFEQEYGWRALSQLAREGG